MSIPPREQPTSPSPSVLTDGVVVLRPRPGSAAVDRRHRHPSAPGHGGGRTVGFVVEHDGREVGDVQVQDQGSGTGRLSWAVHVHHRRRGLATRAVRLLVGYALHQLGLARVEAEVPAGNEAALRVATRAGLHREGVKRVAAGSGSEPTTIAYVVLARLASDPPLTDPTGFRALLNSYLPRKRAIAQVMLRDPEHRVLLCQLTYKRDWDLPGGVVEVGESPRLAAVREVEEELGLRLPPGELVLTDWLPPWGGWDDAICLVFDGGVHDPGLVETLVRQEKEILTARFCDTDEVRARATDFTARRIAAALRNLSGSGGSAYTESGR